VERMQDAERRIGGTVGGEAWLERLRRLGVRT